MRVAAGFHEGAHGAGGFRLAQQHAMHAAPEDLAELPGIVADVLRIGAVHRRLHHHRGRPVARARRPAGDQAEHVLGQTGHVEGAVLHADIDVVGPGLRVLPPLRVGQHVAGMVAGVVDRLPRREQFDRPVDPWRHGIPSKRSRPIVGQNARHGNATARGGGGENTLAPMNATRVPNEAPCPHSHSDCLQSALDYFPDTATDA